LSYGPGIRLPPLPDAVGPGPANRIDHAYEVCMIWAYRVCRGSAAPRERRGPW